jgi:hypothetical protein
LFAFSVLAEDVSGSVEAIVFLGAAFDSSGFEPSGAVGDQSQLELPRSVDGGRQQLAADEDQLF